MKSKRELISEYLKDDAKTSQVFKILGEFRPRPLQEVEYNHIYKTLMYYNGSRLKASKMLGLSYKTLIARVGEMKQVGYDIPKYMHPSLKKD